MLTYGSVCSGIESASVAWHVLGWHAAWFAEIEPFPSAVLAHRWPEVPNQGDMTKLARQVLVGSIQAPDVLVGGTPCQAFSVAGMREGLADPRGALTIKYVELADAADLVRTRAGKPATVIVWENVPGVLSDKGNAFGCFLGALVGESDALQPAGGKWTDAGCVYGPTRTAAWRVLDAQYFGLAQRRRRVFVVASARAGFDTAAVLFEPEGLRRDTPPRRGEGQDVAGHAPFGPALQCGCGYVFDIQAGPYGCPDCEGDFGPAVSVTAGVPAFVGENQDKSLFQAGALNAHGLRNDFASETFCVAPTLAGGARKAGGSATQQDAEQGLLVVHGTQDPCTLVDQAHALGRNSGQENAVCITGDITHTLKAEGFDASEDGTGRGQPIVAALRGISDYGDGMPCLRAKGGDAGGGSEALVSGSAVRRLTPRECERLQGLPDDYTLIPWRGKPAEECPDGPRYKAIGNSKAIPVVRWIGKRIQAQLDRLNH